MREDVNKRNHMKKPALLCILTLLFITSPILAAHKSNQPPCFSRIGTKITTALIGIALLSNPAQAPNTTHVHTPLPQPAILQAPTLLLLPAPQPPCVLGKETENYYLAGSDALWKYVNCMYGKKG
jgi:hypothetical protein